MQDRTLQIRVLASLGLIGHFLRGRSLKGRCNIRVYVPSCSCVCVSPLPPPPDPAHTVGLNSRMPPTPPHDPPPPFPHPYPQAIARPTPGKNYPLKSARSKNPSKSRVRLHDPLGVRPTSVGRLGAGETKLSQHLSMDQCWSSLGGTLRLRVQSQ